MPKISKSWRTKILLAYLRIIWSFICQETNNWRRNDCNNKREDSTEPDGFGDTPLNPIKSLRTTNHLSASLHHSFTYDETNQINFDLQDKQGHLRKGSIFS